MVLLPDPPGMKVGAELLTLIVRLPESNIDSRINDILNFQKNIVL